MKTVLFLCTGNYYRSRFAEHYFNHLAAEQGLRWQAKSCGLETWLVQPADGPISCYTIERLAEHGIVLGDEIRSPIQVTEAALERADLVVAVKEAEHRPMMQTQFPEWVDRIEYWHVDDIDCALPSDALPILETCVEGLVERLLKGQCTRTAPAASR